MIPHDSAADSLTRSPRLEMVERCSGQAPKPIETLRKKLDRDRTGYRPLAHNPQLWEFFGN